MESEAVGPCRICWDSENVEDFFQPCLCRGTQQWVHRSCFAHWTRVAPTAALLCPTCGYRYRRGIISSWQVLFVTAKEASRWLALLVYFCVTRTCARTIYKHLLTDARDGRPFSFNLFWPADFLMASKPQPSLMLLADGLVSALSVTLKRLVRARRIRLPLLFPPPVQIPEATQEFAMQLFCASTLRLGEVLLILRRRTGTAAAVRGLFDWMVNVYAILYLLQELLLSAQRCARDSTQVLAFKTC
ncbi:E3 ubiquitin-protein ligase MARCHF3 (Membrane-associated RING finger protein 3) (Membrane-associated RING-CH protein III) (MARCH-III) (RING finger protein 173) (RING-type E3 ubiquitin transferase MARCHF3) [Durusdinium trenchii]|uniref:RING-CH-type domain-containing protein n=1 Tax=Durusdinium trenchii TaxID=1381693 RepID=A0ABP0M3Z4_9DINO